MKLICLIVIFLFASLLSISVNAGDIEEHNDIAFENTVSPDQSSYELKEEIQAEEVQESSSASDSEDTEEYFSVNEKGE